MKAMTLARLSELFTTLGRAAMHLAETPREEDHPAVTLLREIEWAAVTRGEDACPCCYFERSGGHALDCKLAALIVVVTPAAATLPRFVHQNAIERCCEVFAAITEAKRGDGVSFWREADDRLRAETRRTVEWLLSGGSVDRWVDPQGSEELRRVLLLVAGPVVPSSA